MNRRMTKFAKLILYVLFLGAMTGAQCWAQDIPTETQMARLQVFASGAFVYTRYAAGQNLSLYAGGDFVFRPLFTWQPGVELRATFPIDPRNVDGQRSFLIGPRMEYAHVKYHPYVDFLIGTGTATFKYAYTDPTTQIVYPSESSLVYGIGGGLDYTVTRKLALRLDVQEQFWKITAGYVTSFSPIALSVGGVYRFNFNNENRR